MIARFGGAVLAVLGCAVIWRVVSWEAAGPSVQSRSAVTFTVKADSSLGAKLGMEYSTYRVHRADSESCLHDHDVPELFCIGSPGARTGSFLTVATVKVEAYYLTFFRSRLVEIEYHFEDWSGAEDTLRTALEERFGAPDETRKITKTLTDYVWSSASSSMVLTDGHLNGSGCQLSMQLSRELDALIEARQRARSAAARRDL